MSAKLLAVITLVLFLWPALLDAENVWTFEIFGGAAHSFSTSLKIEGQKTFELDAHYENRPFEDALYYAWRVSHLDARGAWEVELIHHKLYLENLPSGIQRFEVSHGYNLFLVNRSWNIQAIVLRAGGGVVIAHPETEIEGIIGPSEYEWTGPAAQIAAQKRFYLTKRFFAGIEGKLTFSRAHVSIADGTADVPNVALHALFGLGLTL